MENSKDYLDLFFQGELDRLDPFLNELLEGERERQARKLIMIPSESMAPAPVRKALGSVFNNVYAEGYPRPKMRELVEEELQKVDERLGHYRRYADRRFYKGTEYVDLLESLAGRRASECFATEDVPAEEINVNVQPLSGTAANLAIYDSFVEPGDVVMGLSLSQGGHLSHGSEFNRTGKRYEIVSYATDPQTGRLDYEQIRRLARKNEPRMIIAGYTSYSWAPDWEKFRSIADEVGAILLADISHVAGMAIAGFYPNPVGLADVVMTTTHKSICGPRGAIIMTTDPEKAAKVDRAIFPGSQGGPHPNKFAAMALAFKIARRDSFKRLQRRIVENASHLAEALEERGLTLAYGGTDTHLLVIDLRELESETGFTPMGEAMARILDLAHIVTNKNTVPGDASAAEAHGIRMGTPWVSQRGMEKEEMEKIASAVARILKGVKPFNYIGVTGPLSRGKIDFQLLQQVKGEVQELLQPFPPHPQVSSQGEEEGKADQPPFALLELSGHRPGPFLNQAQTRDISDLEPGRGRAAALLNKEGELICKTEIIKLAKGESERYWLLVPREEKERLLNWFHALSDGYVIFDEEDITRKVEGPFLAAEAREERGDRLYPYGPFKEEGAPRLPEPGQLSSPEGELSFYREELGERIYAIAPQGTSSSPPDGLKEAEEGVETGSLEEEPLEESEEIFDLTKPYFIGQGQWEERWTEELSQTGEGITSPAQLDLPPAGEEPRKTPLHAQHLNLEARMAEFAGWEMPFWYSTVREEHRAVREGAGLFDVGHMGVFGVRGEGATEFLNLVTSNYVRWLEEGRAQYTYLLDSTGQPIDDGIVYRLGAENYVLVINAANERKDWHWLKAVHEGRVTLDPHRPWLELPRSARKAKLLDLKEQPAGEGRMDLALQGDASLKLLQRFLSPSAGRRLARMEKNDVARFQLGGKDVIVAGTGYTGEKTSYELLVRPTDAVEIWRFLLEEGEELGLRPAGLGARDSTRIEAGLPLYGHELAGPHGINPTEAGFGAYVKFHKPFFIGRSAYREKAPSKEELEKEIVRFEVRGKARMIREETPVLDQRGRIIGYVTSCAKVGKRQVGMAYLDRGEAEVGDELQFIPSLAGEEESVLRTEIGERFPRTFTGRVLPRFPASGGGGRREEGE